MLEVFDLQVSYGAIKAMDGVSFSVPQGRIVTLLGANGSGKTTALRAITGLAAPGGGGIIFEGRELRGLPTHEIIRAGIALVPEGRRIFANLTVYENLLLGAYLRRDQPAGKLPYGHQRRLEIARALATEPRCLLLDEPAAGLNPQETGDLIFFIRGIHENYNLTILVIEHNLRLVMGLCQHLTVLDHGLTIAAGPPADIRKHPEVIRAYLGE